jgi:hypothetical protein
MQSMDDAANRYRNAVGQGIPIEDVVHIADFAQEATRTQFYADHEDVRFWYEVLERADWNAKVRAVVNAWVEVSLECRRRGGST